MQGECLLAAQKEKPVIKCPENFPWSPSWTRCTLYYMGQASSSAHRHMQQGQLSPNCAAPRADIAMHIIKLMYE